VLDPRLRENLPIDVEANDPDAQTIEDGQVVAAQSYYLGMMQGTQQVVESDGIPLPSSPSGGENRDSELKEKSIKVAGDAMLNILRTWGEASVEAATGLGWLLKTKLGLVPWNLEDPNGLYFGLGDVSRRVGKAAAGPAGRRMSSGPPVSTSSTSSPRS
jgi:hypothetical protein